MSDKPDLKIKKSYLIHDNNDVIIFKYEHGSENFRLPNKVDFKLEIKITRDIYTALTGYFYDKKIILNGNYKILITEEYVNFYNLDKKNKNF